MKTTFITLRRNGFYALASVLAIFMAAAQNAPPANPAPAAPPAQAPAGDANQPGGRGNRGNNNNNVQRGNFGGLDEQQRNLLSEARQVNGDDVRKLSEKLAEAQKEYVKAVVAEKYDEKVVREKADAIGKIQAEILALNGKSFSTVSPTLKPEQRESIEGNARLGIAIISPDRGFGGGPVGNFAGGGPGGAVRGNFPAGGDAAGFGGRGGGGRDAVPGQDRTIRRGGNGGPGNDGNTGNTTRRRGDNPPQ